MEFNIDDKIVQAAAKAPKVFVDASIGDGENYNRETGIQLTAKQIVSLRKYETLGLSFPVRLQDVIAYLNYGAGDQGSVGLAARDFLRTFTMTYDHAKRWAPLREKIMLTGTDLKIFGGSIIRTGNGIVEVYEDLKSSRYLEEHNINTPEEYQKLKLQIPNLPGLGLPEGDVPEIKAYLNDMLAKIKLCHDKAERVRAELDSFGTDMRTEVLPEIKLRLEFVYKNTYRADIKTLQGVIDQRSKEIDELNKQYDALVKEAITAAATLNIGGLILGIYQGVKAENIRAERNRLKEAQQASNQLMASKDQTLNSLNKVRDDLQNLSSVAIEAEAATQNLMLVWNALSAYIAASVQEVDKLNEATSLRRFKNQILSVIEPWEHIKASSDQLLRVFAEADREYEKERLTLKGKARMFSLFNVSGNPAFSMAELRGHNALVQGVNITALMLVEQYDYLPGTVRAMNNLAITINKTTSDLRSQAQATSIKLERSGKKLKDYQAELEYPDDVEEIHEDMEAELKIVFSAMSAQSQDLKSVLKSISSPYDRASSEKWVITLQQDRAFAEERKTHSEVKLVELTEKMKSVSEAIDLIGKAGVEKIGQEVQLSLDNLKALGLAPPQVQVALLAIDTLKKTISGIGEAISYLNMLAAYNRLKESASDLKVQAQKYSKEITKFDGQIELVKTLDQLDDGRVAYVNELADLVADFETFALEFKQDKLLPVESRTDTAIARIAIVVKYLKTIQQS